MLLVIMAEFLVIDCLFRDLGSDLRRVIAAHMDRRDLSTGQLEQIVCGEFVRDRACRGPYDVGQGGHGWLPLCGRRGMGASGATLFVGAAHVVIAANNRGGRKDWNSIGAASPQVTDTLLPSFISTRNPEFARIQWRYRIGVW
ncbi:hypothetical protein [Streptomyces sp. Y7]|uniref:hypothetical protein n=1 Tax=Streptomyces sp. Y7 TaxID=3342392 RepID=UPI003714A1C9